MIIRALAIGVVAAWLCPLGDPAIAQTTAGEVDTLRLGELQDEALQRDPRTRQIGLLASQSALRLRSLEAERLPSISFGGQGQYQSDVVSIPFELPGGVTPPRPGKDSYDAHLEYRQAVYDPVLPVRADLERARRAEEQARVRTTLHDVRQSINDAYFAALIQQTRAAEIEAGLHDLTVRLEMAMGRMDAGTALPSEVAILRAEILRRQQALDELTSARDAVLVVLADLTGRRIPVAAALALPDLRREVAKARELIDTMRARPEYERFARSQELLERQRESIAAQDRLRVSAFGRTGYGRPGLNPLANRFDAYWLTGVTVEWAPWSWGSTRRERQALAIQQQILASDEEAFRVGLQRSVVRELATYDQLQRSMQTDEAIIRLREAILSEARLRFDEGVITSAEYVERETQLLEARLGRATHRVQLAQSAASFLTSLGADLP